MGSRLRARLHFWWQRRICRWRHDYEPIRVTDDGVLMACFYCDRQKLSRVCATHRINLAAAYPPPHRSDAP